MLGKYPVRELFYGDSGLVSIETINQYMPTGALWFRYVPGHDPGLQLYFIGLLAAVVLLILGLFTRLSSILVFLGIIGLSNRDFFVDNHGDDLLRINCLILMFAPAGAAYSLDRWIRVKKGLAPGALEPISPWSQRLLQLQLSYLYINTAYLRLPSESWQDGTALYYALNYLEFFRFRSKYLFYFLWQIKAATYWSLAVEISSGTLAWIPRIRYWVMAAAISLHIGINLMMHFPTFQYIMIASWIAFIYPQHVEAAIDRALRAARMTWVKKDMFKPEAS